MALGERQEGDQARVMECWAFFEHSLTLLCGRECYCFIGLDALV